MDALIDTTLDVVLPIVAAILTTIAIPALMSWLKANKIVADEVQARILQSALENAAETAIARAGGAMPPRTSDAAQAAISYVRASVPDTVRRLKLDDSQIVDLVVPHLQRVGRDVIASGPGDKQAVTD